MRSRENFELGGELGVAATGQVGFDARLQGREPRLFQPCALGPDERRIGHIAERRSAPQREGFPERLAGLAVFVPGQLFPTPQ